MKIRCDNCGHKNPQDAQLCEECGAPLNRKKRPIVKLIVLFLALLLVDTALWFYFAHKPTQVRITVTSQNPEFGVVKGDSTYCQSDTITIVAIAKEGYRFVKWNDGNTDSVRTVVVHGNVTYTAYFASDNGAEGIDEPQNRDNIQVFARNNSICISGACGQRVFIYGIDGRMVATRRNATEQVSIPVPATGVYFVKVGNLPARKVVVIR